MKKSILFALLLGALCFTACDKKPASTPDASEVVKVDDTAKADAAAKSDDKKADDAAKADAAKAEDSAKTDDKKADDAAKADDTKAVDAAQAEPKGLVIKINGKPEGSSIKHEVLDNGTYDIQDLVDGAYVLGTSRIAPIGDGKDSVSAYINKTADAARELKVEQDESLTAKLTYPSYKAVYLTGHNEDTRENMDIIITTDKHTFILHVSYNPDFIDEYKSKIDEIISGLELVEVV